MGGALVDFHCDTLTKALQVGELAKQCSDWHVDLQRLATIGSTVQVFAIWTNPGSRHGCLHAALAMIEIFWRAVESGTLRPVLYKSQVVDEAGSCPGGLLSIEGAEPLGGDEILLHALYRLGVRAIGLTWNGRNDLADGVGESCSKGGLTHAGRRIVAAMNRLGMIVDVSHLAPAGFWDVVEACNKPFVASHSNAFSVCGHPRNLTDEQLQAIAAHNGVVGLNLYPSFLSAEPQTGLVDVLRHAEHMLKVMGPNHVGLGADFDGISSTPVGLSGVECLPQVREAFVAEFGPEIAAGIMGGNFSRLLREVLPAAPL